SASLREHCIQRAPVPRFAILIIKRILRRRTCANRGERRVFRRGGHKAAHLDGFVHGLTSKVTPQPWALRPEPPPRFHRPTGGASLRSSAAVRRACRSPPRAHPSARRSGRRGAALPGGGRPPRL